MAENWAGLAEAIGMVRYFNTETESEAWRDDRVYLGDNGAPADLATYLMEPEQTARILARLPLRLSPVEGNLYVVWAYPDRGGVVRECGPVCEAVARCAAGLL